LALVKLTPPMAAMPRHRPFGRGSAVGVFGHDQTVGIAAEFAW